MQKASVLYRGFLYFCLNRYTLNLLQELSKKHQDWLKMAVKLGAEFPEDVVQDMYIKMHKYVDKPERILYEHREVNTFYVYVTIRSIVADHYKIEQRQPVYLSMEELMNCEEITFADLKKRQDIRETLEAIKDEMKEWHWYDKTMFDVYFGDDVSIRKLSDLTGISVSSIFNTLKNGKEKIKQALFND